MEWLDKVYFGNSLEDYAWFVGMVLLALIFRKFISRYISHFIYLLFKKSSYEVGRDQFDEMLKKPLNFLVLVVTLYIGSNHLEFPIEWHLAPPEEFGWRMVLLRAFHVAFIYAITWTIMRMTDYLGLIFLQRADRTESKLDDQLIPFLVDAIKVIVGIMAVFLVLAEVFDVNITTLIAGLGVGGIALALAAKESLENLLGSITIFFDKPFAVGDLITVGGTTGTVEKVGFRSTRLRTPDKTFVTVPNKLLTSTELDNLTLRTHRRARFFIGLTYDTSVEQMKAIVAEIQKLIDDHERTTSDGRVRFQEFNASSLDILIQYLVDTMDWTTFLDVKEEINYKIMEIVEKHGSSFAFPSTSVYIEKNNPS